MKTQMKVLPVCAILFAVSTPAKACEAFGNNSWVCNTPSTSFKKAAVPGVDRELAAVYAYVRARCKGIRVVSAVRRTYISGSRRRSLHWSGNALDFRASSYRCAYAALRSYGWKGGWARDGVRCRHIHISYGGRWREPAGFRHRSC